MIDFTKFMTGNSGSKETDPIKLFYSLPKVENSVGDLWFPQGEALKAWSEKRDNNDILINLDTGGGKTLIGLLIAQSIVNEGNKKVIYLCSNNQLVSQVKEKAESYNLKVTTYTGKEKFSDFGYASGESPLITSYHALFNGWSVFLNDDIDALIFDDAHTVQNIFRSQFSLYIENCDYFKSAYERICELLFDYYKSVNRDSTFKDITSGSDDTVIFVPTFLWTFHLDKIKQILYESNIQDSNNRFAWEFLKDNLDVCSAYISMSGIEITPLLPPTDNLPYFSKQVRRIYLSATLNNIDEFYKTFGKKPDLTISPPNSAGKCERMILMPKLSQYCNDSFEWVKKAIESRKTLIITPTKPKARKWRELYEQEADVEITHNVINNFKESKGNDKLILTSRYDGIDFPEDTCRCLVVDGLPSGMNLIDKFLWRHLSLSNVLKTAIASRVMQALGRTTRGVKDYSVVLLCGADLEQWLINSKNRESISNFVCQQLSLGDLITKDLDSVEKLCESVNAFFERNKSWIDTYNHMVKVDSVMHITQKDDNLHGQVLLIAEAEKKFSNKLWGRDFEKAARILENALDTAFKFDKKLGHWYQHWIGFSYKLAGNVEAAAKYYIMAGEGERLIGRYFDLEGNYDDTNKVITEQVIRILKMFMIDGKIDRRAIAEFKTRTGNISVDATYANFEQSICELGTYLGYISTRPDNKYDTGPDNLWQPIDNEYSYLIFEDKNEKKDNGVIYKKDVTKIADHVNWTARNTDVKRYYKILITDCKLISDKANPDEDIYVISIDEFKKVRDKLIGIIEKLTEKAPSEYERKLLYDLEEAKIDWGNIMDSFEKELAIDLPIVNN